jgi:hypothetical protein
VKAKTADQPTSGRSCLRFPVVGKLNRLLLLGLVAVGVLALTPAGQARTTANPTLRVNFFTNGSIAVTLPDGTPVGTASGAPTQIPGGYYTVMLFGPGGCSNVPYFELKGPGTSIVDNMDEGELATNQYNAVLQPNSTYTWKDDDAVPPVTYTFTTTGDMLGAPPAQSGTNGNSASNHGSAASTNPLGSQVATSRGSLTASVSATGAVSLAYKGKSVKSVAPGKYTITVTDRSAKSGFMLQKGTHSLNITSVAFVGKHSTTVTLTAGKWLFTTRVGQKTYPLNVT